MEIIITMSIICMGILLLMLQTRTPRLDGRSPNGDRWAYKPILVVLFALVLIFVSALRKGWQDTGLYKEIYRTIGTDFDRAFNENFIITDVAFNILMVLLNFISSDPQLLIAVCAVVILSVYTYTVVKYSSDLPSSLLLLLCYVFIPTMNGIRQILAGAIMVLGWHLLRDKRIVPFILLSLFASRFHASAIVMIPLSLILCGKRYNRGIWMFVAFLLFCFAAPSLANRLIGTILEDTTYADYLDNESKMGVVRLVVEFVPVLLSFLYHKLISPYETTNADNAQSCQYQRMVDMLINMQVISFGFTVLGLKMVYFARISMYFSLTLPLLLPEMISRVFNRKSARFVKPVALILYILYFAYQVYTYEMIDGWGGMELNI